MGNTEEIHLFCFISFFSLSWYQHEHPSKDCFWTWRFPVVCQMHAGRKWLCQPSNMWRMIQTNDAAWRPSWCSALVLEVGSVEGQLGYLLMNIWSKIMRLITFIFQDYGCMSAKWLFPLPRFHHQWQQGFVYFPSSSTFVFLQVHSLNNSYSICSFMF